MALALVPTRDVHASEFPSSEGLLEDPNMQPPLSYNPIPGDVYYYILSALIPTACMHLSYSLLILLCLCVRACVRACERAFVTEYDHCGVLGTVDKMCPCTYI